MSSPQTNYAPCLWGKKMLELQGRIDEGKMSEQIQRCICCHVILSSSSSWSSSWSSHDHRGHHHDHHDLVQGLVCANEGDVGLSRRCTGCHLFLQFISQHANNIIVNLILLFIVIIIIMTTIVFTTPSSLPPPHAGKSSLERDRSNCQGQGSSSKMTFIGPRSNHCIARSLTFGTFGTLGLLGLDATQACEDTWSKFCDVVADYDIDVVESFGPKMRWLIASWQLGNSLTTVFSQFPKRGQIGII